jgi:hypothetical protein
MKLSAVTLARAIGFVETFDLSPRTSLFIPEFVKEVLARYNFQKFPQEFKDFDEQKGVEFLHGKSGDTVIDKLVVYTDGLLIDTRSNTKVSEQLIEEALLWGKSKFGLVYQPGMIKRFAYVSQVTFYSDVQLDGLNPALKKLSSRITSAISDIRHEPLEYQTIAVIIGHDPLKAKNPVAAFTIFPRAATPFTEHKYFSEAPLPTDLHLELLQEFEAGLATQK